MKRQQIEHFLIQSIQSIINMVKKLQNRTFSGQQDSQISAQLHPDAVWTFKSFSLQESSRFIPYINDFYSQNIENFLSGCNQPYLQQNSLIEIGTPKTEEGQYFEAQFKVNQQPSQNIQSFKLQEQNQQKDYQASYHRGHIQYLRQLKTPIFLQSRKFCKSKKKMKKGKTYYKFIAKHMKGYASSSCKRFDQYHLQQSYKNLDNREQEKKQATLEAIRHLKKYRKKSENERLLEKHKERYSASRKWALFLNDFVNNGN